MKRIDLVCKMLAPAFVGIWLSSFSAIPCLIATVAWNGLSLALEYRLLSTVFHRAPALQKLSRSKKCQDKLDPRALTGVTQLVKGACIAMIDGWASYFRQEVVLAAVALAVLHCTVLSFGFVMTAALAWKGVPAHIIGVARGLGAFLGVAATYMYPVLQSREGTGKAGLWAISTQWLCLMVSVASVWIHKTSVAASLLISGIVASRLGLWMFDLAVTQLMQSTVEEQERGRIGGVQSALQSLMTLLSFVITILAPDPKEFGRLVIISYVIVTIAALLFSSYFYRSSLQKS
ncbi:solute carrier family 40 member 1-like [Selaginella moellendorffii]|uniref:solute carrier family 40 member 1-like n=1 Tax=Selaginella moellendorffii TaxID=88036 RepID=UPI000D1CCFDD|nr:solute carrier family 40 member 1-like [Selaginella moellendorffii]|eukprot:XP_024529854.1 solute carrier family 40 member 1-like [Selaginella moellendorffii]